MSDAVLVERDGPLVWLVLNRPERLNAINQTMLGELQEALESLRGDTTARVVAIRGSGRCFSSGYDLSGSRQPEANTADDAVADFDRILSNVRVLENIWDFPKPVIAAVHGYCLAGATQLCLFCDITVVAEDAQIGFPSIPLGGGYISPMWMPLVGVKRAKQMSFVAASKISGRTAVEWGWANYSVQEKDLLDEVASLAKRIAKTPPGVLRMKKYSLNRAAEIQGFKLIPGLGAETDALLHHTEEVKEMQRWIREDGIKEGIRRFEEEA